MTREKISIEKLKTQRDALNTRLQAAYHRQKTTARKQDTRRKILVGAYYLEQANKLGQEVDLQKAMDSFLTRDSDRALFGLPPSANGHLSN